MDAKQFDKEMEDITQFDGNFHSLKEEIHDKVFDINKAIVIEPTAGNNDNTDDPCIHIGESRETNQKTNSLNSLLNGKEFDLDIVRSFDRQSITKQVIRKKLSKMRHLVMPKLISPNYLDIIFKEIKSNFEPQTVIYNGGIGNVPEWKISCYLEVTDGIPTTQPNKKLLEICLPMLQTCNKLFKFWYQQQHSCNNNTFLGENMTVKRIMTFITRYTPAPGEQALLKHVDGAGKVDGSIVVALPIESDEKSFYGHGGGLTFWDGKPTKEMFYDTRPGDVAFIDRAVW